jgi:DNA modification methylase
MGDWDIDNLKIELDELEALDFDIGKLGFDDDFLLDELERIESTESGETDDDQVPEVSTKEPIIKLGDIIELGDHRIMCGDSTSADDVGLLVDNNKIDLVYTDPPYGIDYHADREGYGKIKRTLHDKIIWDNDTTVATKTVKLVLDMFAESSMIFWGANYYCQALPNDFGWLFWDKKVSVPTFSKGEFAFTNRGVRSNMFEHRWSGMLRDSERGSARLHPNQKPVALAEWCFDNYGNPETILDLFLGSGSTLIACQKLNRKCYGMELDPKYCDIIIKRYCDYVGNNNIKINGNDYEF